MLIVGYLQNVMVAHTVPMYLESLSSSPLLFIEVGGFWGIGKSTPPPASPPFPPLPEGVSFPFLEALPPPPLALAALPPLLAFNASSAS